MTEESLRGSQQDGEASIVQVCVRWVGGWGGQPAGWGGIHRAGVRPVRVGGGEGAASRMGRCP